MSGVSVNFDANACYGLIPEVLSQLTSMGELISNPSSIHTAGQRARASIESAREKVGALVSATPGTYRVIFTSGATEANNMALHAPFLPIEDGLGQPPEGVGDYNGRIVVSSLEHPSVLEAARRVGWHGANVVVADVVESGSFSREALLQSIDDDTRLVSLMSVNNETGQIFPVAEAVKAIRAVHPQVLIHTDAVQAAGKMSVDIGELDVDLLTLSAHKIGGLPGCGALIIRDEIEARPHICGGAQESRWRSGTENVSGIVSFGIAAEAACSGLRERAQSMLAARMRIERALSELSSNLVIRCQNEDRVPNTICMTIPGIAGDDLVVAADLEGVLISSGAACASGKPLPSHVLQAMGLSAEQAGESIRISVRHDLSESCLELGIESICRAIERMQTVRSCNEQLTEQSMSGGSAS